MEQATQNRPLTAYDRLGGQPVVRRIVDRFYDLMEADPAYAELRAMHAPDLTPMRASLTGFLTAWLGGPRDWFEERPGLCMMSAHRGVTMTEPTARQWADAMTRAVQDAEADPELAAKMAEALAGMALNMGGVGR
ncbi:group II truncated hemoglobin [Novosphingobium sp. JCM 18896]|uniref:group II truncated hemoglobin n=1 Tax=Novosphingobium sp. JCM 18896 TaxID=2989731 RepID=UPI002221C3B8|nr:group II truncated hemoglobin [Novosphingobium sp. JCM 18896]MCW1428993.1 group II truncated hemoglobin [Novosphingobium sp. JCM 18896]